MNNSILDIKVSCFASCEATIPQNVNLLTWLTSERHRAKVENLRSIQDEDLQKVIKKSLPAITPSGLFSYRAEKDLIEHSGFMVFDIDKKDNRNISFSDLKEQVSHIPSIAYCGLSVRGFGLWGLVPIPKSTPEEHKQRFAALKKDFKVFDINLDPSGSDVCRLRIYSWDTDGYFNHSAKLYTKILKPQQRKSEKPVYSDTRDKVEAIIFQIKQDKIDITENYENWMKIASALENEFSESGRGYFHTVSMFHPKYSITEADRMFDNVLKHNNGKVKIGTFFHIASAGVSTPVKTLLSTIDKGIHNTKKELSHNPVTILQKVEKIIPAKHGIWSNEITELEGFFKAVKLPMEPVELNSCTRITDINLFIETHLSIAKAQDGNDRFLPYLNRLQEFKQYIKNNLN